MLKQNLLNIIALLSIYFTNNVMAKELSIEVKEIDPFVFFILYHDRDINPKTSFNQKEGSFDILLTITDLQTINPLVLAKHAEKIYLGDDSQTVNFITKDQYDLIKIITGEKLTAIKLKKFRDKEDIAKSNIQDNIISCGIVENDIVVKAPFLKDVKFAAFIKDKYVWLVFDKYKQFQLQQTELLEGLEQMQNKKYSIIRFQKPDMDNISLDQKNNMWVMRFSEKKLVSQGEKFQVLKQTNNNTTELQVKLNQSFVNTPSIINFIEPETSQNISVLAFDGKVRMQESYIQSPQYTVIPTLYGFAFLTYNDQLQISASKDSVKISYTNLEQRILEATSNNECQLKGFKRINEYASLLQFQPLLSDKYFIDGQDKILNAISHAENNKILFSLYVDLSKFYFQHRMFNEAAASLVIAKNRSPEGFNKADILFLEAVSLTLSNQCNDAEKVYEYMKDSLSDLPSEVYLWSNFNNYKNGKKPHDIGTADCMHKFMEHYPESLYWELFFADMDMAIKMNNWHIVNTLFGSSRKPQNQFDIHSYQYWQAIMHYAKNELQIAKDLLLELSNLKNDDMNSARSLYYIIKIKLSTNEITGRDAIAMLESLQYRYRGGPIEYNILMTLADLYKQNAQYINSLRTYKDLINNFDSSQDCLFINAEMSTLFKKIFLPDVTTEAIEDLTMIGLFREFKELIPIGIDGDQITLNIVDIMVNLDLIDQAIQILNHQVDYRLGGRNQIAKTNRLALLYIINNQPLNAIKVIDDTAQSNLIYQDHLERLRIKAIALIDLAKYNEAVSLVINDESGIAKEIVKEAYFNAELWQEYIDYTLPRMPEHFTSNVEDIYLMQDIIRLTISYAMTGQYNKVKSLKERSYALNNEKLLSLISMISMADKSIDPKQFKEYINIDLPKGHIEKYKEKLFN